jgi:hypothetical protein
MLLLVARATTLLTKMRARARSHHPRSLAPPTATQSPPPTPYTHPWSSPDMVAVVFFYGVLELGVGQKLR